MAKNLTNGAILKRPEFECDPASSSTFGLGLDEPEKTKLVNTF